MSLARIAVIGAGGLARETAWIIEELNSLEPRFDFVGYIVSDLSSLTDRDDTDLLLGDESWLDLSRGEVDALALGIGTPVARLSVARRLAAMYPDLAWPSLIHPDARYQRASCTVGRGAVIGAGVVATVNVEVAEFTMINLNATIGHECRIGAGSVLNPSANLSGGVVTGEAVLIGTGAQLLQYVKVGDGATVGAGAVCTSDVAPGTTVVGVPARPLSRGD